MEALLRLYTGCRDPVPEELEAAAILARTSFAEANRLSLSEADILGSTSASLLLNPEIEEYDSTYDKSVSSSSVDSPFSSASSSLSFRFPLSLYFRWRR